MGNAMAVGADHGLASKIDLVMNADPKLKSLQGDPRFEPLIADARQHAASAQQAK
jgi:hypothetical protein